MVGDAGGVGGPAEDAVPDDGSSSSKLGRLFRSVWICWSSASHASSFGGALVLISVVDFINVALCMSLVLSSSNAGLDVRASVFGAAVGARIVGGTAWSHRA